MTFDVGLAPTAPSLPAALAAEDVHKSFGATAVLKGVSLRAAEGEVLALIGASGSGKSTLLRCLNLLEIPDSGRITIGGEPVALRRTRHGMRPADPKHVQRLRASLGMVFQSFNLWSHRTVLENVIEAPVHVLGQSKAEATERAEALLARVGLTDRRNHYPQHLSGGQQQRAAIARALAMQPRAMLFDEPTSALDPELVGEVLRVIRSLAEEGRTMVLVTHEMRFAREVATHVLFLHKGEIAEQGAAERVFSAPESTACRSFLQDHY